MIEKLGRQFSPDKIINSLKNYTRSNIEHDIYLQNNYDDIIEKIKYILKTPLKKIGKLYLDQASLKAISQLILQYLAYHMDIRDLKSEAFLSTDPSGAERK